MFNEDQHSDDHPKPLDWTKPEVHTDHDGEHVVTSEGDMNIHNMDVNEDGEHVKIQAGGNLHVDKLTSSGTGTVTEIFLI